MNHPSKQHALLKNIPKRPETQSSGFSQSRLRISEIRVVNDFSADSQFLDRSSILEQSLEQEIRRWSVKVDQNVVQKVEKEIKEIDNQIMQLAAQFDVSLSLQKKTEDKFLEFQRLMKGTQFTKLSRSNCKNSAKRMIFYCPFLDSICWKSKQSKFPTAKQTIPMEQIVQIHTSYNKYRLFRKGFTLPQNLDPECFLAIEGRNGLRLELIAEKKEDQIMFTRLLTYLMSSKEIDNTEKCFLEQYSVDINQIRRNLDKSKDCFIEAMDRLQQHFIQNITILLNEKKALKKQSHHMQVNNILIDDLHQDKIILEKRVKDLELERDYLESRNEQLQEYYNQRQYSLRSTNNPQTLALLQMIRDIVGMNGDQSMESEVDIRNQDYYQESVQQLQKLKSIVDKQQNTEIELRQNIQILEDQIKENKKKYKDEQQYIEDLEKVNELLQQKLKEINQEFDSKEKQFKLILDDMQKFQLQMQNMSPSQQCDSDRFKEIVSTKLESLKTHIMKEEQNWLAHFILMLCYINHYNHIEEYDVTLCVQYLQQQSKGLPNVAQQFIHSLCQKHQFFLKNYKEQYKQQFREYMLLSNKKHTDMYSPISTANSHLSHQSPKQLFKRQTFQ